MATKAGKAILPKSSSKPQQRGSFVFSLSPSKADKPPYHSPSAPSGQQNAPHDSSWDGQQPGIARQGSTSTVEQWQCRQAGWKTLALPAEGASSASVCLDSSAPPLSAHEHDSSALPCRAVLERDSSVKLAARVSQLSLAEDERGESLGAQQQASARGSGRRDAARGTDALENGSKPDMADVVAVSSSGQAGDAEDNVHGANDIAAAHVPSSKALSAAADTSRAGGLISRPQEVPTGSSSTAGNGSGRPRMSMNFGLQPGPVFVPIVLTMDNTDHELLVEEWLLRQVLFTALLLCNPPMGHCRIVHGCLTWYHTCTPRPLEKLQRLLCLQGTLCMAHRERSGVHAFKALGTMCRRLARQLERSWTARKS